MKIIYKGKWDGLIASLPRRDHEPGAVAFQEARSPEEMGRVLFPPSLVLLIVLTGLYWLRAGGIYLSPLGILLAFLGALPHEYLHALFMKDTAYIYTNLRQGMLFVTTTESMGRARFVGMSLFPNILFGWIPYLLAMVQPQWRWLASFGILSTVMGIGDYYNVKNALTQMPKTARTYLHGFNSFWYLPKDRS